MESIMIPMDIPHLTGIPSDSFCEWYIMLGKFLYWHLHKTEKKYFENHIFLYFMKLTRTNASFFME